MAKRRSHININEKMISAREPFAAALASGLYCLYFICLMILFPSCTRMESPTETGTSAAMNMSRDFTFSDNCNKKDAIFLEIMQDDLKGKSTPLELMHYYAEILNTRTSHKEIDDKLDALFLCGRAPQDMKGFYHGITISLKTGTDIYGFLNDAREKLGIGAEVDVLQALYGRLLSKTSPWAGKDFRKMEPVKIGEMTKGAERVDQSMYLGINSFRKDDKRFVNNVSDYILAAVMNTEKVQEPRDHERSWIHSKGGLFIAKKTQSVNAEHPDKEVMALNYRWKSLGNVLPNKLLIDEIVEISDGLYLGKLYYATSLKYIFKDYDTGVSKEDYHYRNFGYFLLMDDTWLAEKNRLWPDLAYNLTDNLSNKFRTFRFIDSAECSAIQKDIGSNMTILHYLRGMYQAIQDEPEAKKRYFDRLLSVFRCGQRPDGIQGFLRGGVVTFDNGGFLRKFDRTVLNDIYPLVKQFSPWTGKTFTASDSRGIKKYIGGSAAYYDGRTPVIVGTNTYRKELGLSLPVTAFIEHLKGAGMVVEYPDEKEKSEDIYVKSFYFIATNTKSINPDNAGKEVLQFNYRWPEFHTMTPDHLCLDELVRIADGLYLGQLLYSTKPEIAYDPGRDPADYAYENFGYFMLMDDEWYAVKEFIKFDAD